MIARLGALQLLFEPIPFIGNHVIISIHPPVDLLQGLNLGLQGGIFLRFILNPAFKGQGIFSAFLQEIEILKIFDLKLGIALFQIGQGRLLGL